jgi:L-threonylcarbamoyladenylate synthase
MGAVEQAVAAINSGQPVLLPTDTVYGLCVSPFGQEPVARLYRLKDRPETIPSALLCSDLERLFECVPELRGEAGGCIRALLPGPYTLILPNPGRRFPWLNGPRPDTIGVRVPVLEGPVREVLEQVGAVTATSANRHGGPDPKRLDDVPQEIRRGCAAEIDGGELPGVPSTVLDLTGSQPGVVREGAVPAAEALALLADATTA